MAFVLRWPLPLREWTQVDKRALVLYPLGFWGGDFNPHFFHYPALFYVYFLLPRAEALEYFGAYHYFVDPSDRLAIARTANELVVMPL